MSETTQPFPACTINSAVLAGDDPGFAPSPPELADAPEPIRLVPLGSKILVELVDVAAEESAIFTAATVDSPTEYGRVLDMGPEATEEQQYVPERFQVGVGSIVQFGKFSGYALEGERTMLIRLADLNGIVTGGIVTTRANRAKAAAEGVRKIVTTGPITPADERRLRQEAQPRTRKDRRGVNPAKRVR